MTCGSRCCSPLPLWHARQGRGTAYAQAAPWRLQISRLLAGTPPAGCTTPYHRCTCCSGRRKSQKGAAMHQMCIWWCLGNSRISGTRPAAVYSTPSQYAVPCSAAVTLGPVGQHRPRPARKGTILQMPVRVSIYRHSMHLYTVVDRQLQLLSCLLDRLHAQARTAQQGVEQHASSPHIRGLAIVAGRAQQQLWRLRFGSWKTLSGSIDRLGTPAAHLL